MWLERGETAILPHVTGCADAYPCNMSDYALLAKEMQSLATKSAAQEVAPNDLSNKKFMKITIWCSKQLGNASLGF
jgi:hypothetical protein